MTDPTLIAPFWLFWVLVWVPITLMAIGTAGLLALLVRDARNGTMW